LEAGSPPYIVDWLQNNHWDKTTKIIAIDRYDSSVIERVGYTDVEVGFFFGGLKRAGAPDIATNLVLDTENTAFVIGMEKPLIQRKNGNWYSIFMAAFTHDSPRKDNFVEKIIPFYLDPEFPALCIKQSHIAVKNVIAALNPQSDWNSNDFVQNGLPYSHMQFSFFCGRLAGLCPESTSMVQKIITKNMMDSPKSTLYYAWKTGTLNRPELKEFKHLYELSQDSRFHRYLVQHNLLLKNQDLTKIKQIASRMYKIM